MAWPQSLKVVIPVLAAALIASGCGTTVDDAEQRLCEDLAGLKADLATLNSAAGAPAAEEGSAQDLDAAIRQSKRSWQDVVNDLQDVKGARSDDLEDSWDDLRDALEDVDSDSTLEEAREEVGPAFTEFSAARDEMFSRLECA
jgi:hypothetical protein